MIALATTAVLLFAVTLLRSVIREAAARNRQETGAREHLAFVMSTIPSRR